MEEAKFYRASNPKDACDLLSKYKGKAYILAGGTDLMVQVNRRLIAPKTLIYIGESELSYIKEDGNTVIIGATATFSEIMDSSMVQEKIPLLVAAVNHIGSPAIRNMGTIGGNLANASPAADSAIALLVLGAQLKLISKNSERYVDISDFFIGPGKTLLQPDELLKEVVIPSQSPMLKWSYRKLGRRKANTLSVVSVAISFHFNNGVCSGARIGLGAVAPTPLFSNKAAAIMEGKRLDDKLIEQVARSASEETEPIDDLRATAWYRQSACAAVIKQLLRQFVV